MTSASSDPSQWVLHAQGGAIRLNEYECALNLAPPLDKLEKYLLSSNNPARAYCCPFDGRFYQMKGHFANHLVKEIGLDKARFEVLLRVGLIWEYRRVEVPSPQSAVDSASTSHDQGSATPGGGASCPEPTQSLITSTRHPLAPGTLPVTADADHAGTHPVYPTVVIPSSAGANNQYIWIPYSADPTNFPNSTITTTDDALPDDLEFEPWPEAWEHASKH